MRISCFSSVTFWQKFREINVFTKENSEELLSRNMFVVVRDYSLFFLFVRVHSVEIYEIMSHFLSKPYSRNFSKTHKTKFANIHAV